MLNGIHTVDFLISNPGSDIPLFCRSDLLVAIFSPRGATGV